MSNFYITSKLRIDKHYIAKRIRGRQYNILQINAPLLPAAESIRKAFGEFTRRDICRSDEIADGIRREYAKKAGKDIFFANLFDDIDFRENNIIIGNLAQPDILKLRVSGFRGIFVGESDPADFLHDYYIAANELIGFELAKILN